MALHKFDDTSFGPVYVNPEYVVMLAEASNGTKTMVTVAIPGPTSDGGKSNGPYMFTVNLDLDTVASRLNYSLGS